jgi:hypothetical protein
MTDNESQGSSLLSAFFTVIFFSVIATSIVSIILATTTDSVSFNLEGLYKILAYTGDLVTYGGVVLGFAIGGLIGGVRVKSSEKGFIAGFFGAFLGGLFAFILATLEDFSRALETGDFSIYSDVLPPYVIGMIGIMAAASIVGFGAGKTTQPKQKSKKRAQSKIKSWDKSKAWKCTNCGNEIPPGRDRCPSCGRAAF